MNIFPDSVTAHGSWQNMETLGDQNLKEDSLYQQFTESNSAFVVVENASSETPAETGGDESSVKSDDESSPPSAPKETDTETATDRSTQTATSTEDTATSESEDGTKDDATEEGKSNETPDAATSSQPTESQEETSAKPKEDSIPDAESEENLQPEPEDMPKAEATGSTTVLRRISGAMSFAFTTVWRSFPFVQSATTTESSEQREETSTSESEQTEVDTADLTESDEGGMDNAQSGDTVTESAASDIPETDAANAGSESEQTPEDTPTKTNATSTAPPALDMSSSETEAQTTESETASEQAASEPNTKNDDTNAADTDKAVRNEKNVQNTSRTHTIRLDGFAVPIATSTEITGGQFRMSFAAREQPNFAEQSDHTFHINYSFDNGESWQSGGSIDIDDEVSNSINGGYFLFALPEFSDPSKLADFTVELTYVGDISHLDGIYLDSAWLELFTAEPKKVDVTEQFVLPESGYDPSMLHGDELKLPDGKEIKFTFTDENTDESLIIKSDKRTYTGLTKATAYFNVTNTSDTQDTFTLESHFGEDNGKMLSLEEYNRNKKYEITVPEYRPYIYHCEAGWKKHGEDLISDFSDFGSLSSTSSETNGSEPKENDSKKNVPPQTSSTTSSESIDDTQQATSTTETTPETEQTASGVSTPTSTATSTEDTFDFAPATTTNELIVASVSEQILKTTSMTLPRSTSTATSNNVTASTTEDVATSYSCGETNVVRTCDALEGDGTACRVNNKKVAEHSVVQFRPGWQRTMAASGTPADTRGIVKKVTDFFGFGAPKKEIPAKFSETYHSPETYSIAPGETKYFKMTLAFDPFTSGEFWIEATGEDEVYGLLDPFWSSEWSYRLPITLDNTGNQNALTEQQVRLTLDNATSSFWSNVTNDGSDVRFIREIPGGNSSNWYNPSWHYRTKLTIQSSAVDDDLSDFPVHVDLSSLGFDFFNRVQGDGGDIRVTKSDGLSELPREVVEISSTTQTGELYFKADGSDAISSSSDSVFYIYYGNSSADNYTATSTYGAENVWTNNFAAVYHLGEDSGLDVNLLNNPGAESGINDWSNEGSATVSAGTDNNGLAPYAGTYYFDPAAGAEALLTQTVDLSSHGYTDSEIDNDSISFTLSAQQGHSFAGDQGQIIMEFLSSGGTTLATSATPLQETVVDDWEQVQTVATAPVGTRSIKVTLRSILLQGSVPNAQFDVVVLRNSADQVPQAIDSTANGNNGTYLGTSRTTGFLGNGQQMSGYINVPDDATLDIADAITISSWVYPTDADGQIVNKGGEPETYSVGIHGQSFEFTREQGDGTNEYLELTANAALNNWHHVVAVDDDTNMMLYVDSVQDATTRPSSGWSAGTDDSPVQIGDALTSASHQEAGGFGDWGGVIDEIRISSVTRSPEWISTAYTNQHAPATFYATSSAEELESPTFTELDFWLQHFDTSTQTGDVWVQVDSIPANATSTIYLYYGNASSNSTSDEFEPFTYGTTTPSYYVVDPTVSGTIEVYSLIDDNVVQLDSGPEILLDRGESTSLSGYASTSVIRSLGPISAAVDNNPGETVFPAAFATTTFLNPTNRNTSQHFILSPFASSSVQTFIGGSGTPDESFSISTGTAMTSNTDGGGNGVVIESSNPILVAHETTNNRDALVLYPPTTEDLFGVDSQNTYISTVTDNPDPDVYCSGGNTGTVTGITRGEHQSVGTCTAGADGTGDAVRFADAVSPVAAIQQADSDGADSTAFWPQSEFGTRYYIPTASNYVAVVCSPRFGTSTVEVQTNAGVTIDSATCAPSGNLPGKAYFDNLQGGDSLAYVAGNQVVSTNGVPFYLMYENNIDSGERNIIGSVQARKFAQSSIKTAFGTPELNNDAQYEQSSYRWFENADMQTPTTPWSLGDGETAGENEAITGAGGVSDNDVLRLRMNLTANVATGSIDTSAFTLQYVESDTCSAAGGWHDVGDIGSTTAAFSGYNNGSVTDGATLSSTTLSASTVFASYEEENDSTFIQNEIGVGEFAEWDWVIKSTNAAVNTSYCFRMVRSTGELLVTYTGYPRLETSGPPNKPELFERFDNEHASSTEPTFEFATTDLAGNDLHYEIEVDDDYQFGSAVITDDSESSFLAFENQNEPSDKAPFDAGARVRYTPSVSLTNGTTYWWRVRAKDPTGSNTYGAWSDPYSFTVNTGITVSEWFQTTDEQFETNSLTGATTTGSDSVELAIGSSEIGEYGSVNVTNGATTTVNLDRSYSEPIVVASVRYSRNVPNGDQVSARVFNKGGTSFDVIHENFTNNAPGTSTLDYIVMEAGEYIMDDGGSGLRVFASSTSISGYIGDPISGDPGTDITFPTSFATAPVVLSAVTTRNDPDWVLPGVYDGNDVQNPPTATQMGLYLHDSLVSDGHNAAEDIDFIVFDAGDGSNNGAEFDILSTGAVVDDTSDTISFDPSFSSTPGVTAVQQLTMNGPQGSYAMVDIDTPATASDVTIAVDEGTSGGRTHTSENIGIVAFGNASGTITRAANGQITSTVIDFDDADVGNAWGQVSWNDSGDVTYRVQYNTGSGFANVPDSALSGNSSGFITSPVSILGLDTGTYNELRLVASLSGVNPEVSDWTLSWGQRVEIPTVSEPFDHEKISTTTPTFEFTTIDPESDDLEYEFSYSTDNTFESGSTTVTSNGSVGFSNLTTPADTNPFNSGDSISYTIPSGSSLTDNTTYWYRVRARDPGGGGSFSPWSAPRAFTVDTGTTVSTWFQTTAEQFQTGTLSGLSASSTGENVTNSTRIGEYGTAVVTNGSSTVVSTNRSYNDPVVVASVRYDISSETQRVARVLGKSSNQFTVLVDNYNSSVSGTTTVDYLVMEAGDWTIQDGSGGTRVVAGTAEDISTVRANNVGDGLTGRAINFSPAFTGAPSVITTVSSNNDSSWVFSSIHSPGSVSQPPTAAGFITWLNRNLESATHGAEDIDYVAFETGHGTNNGSEFDFVVSSDSINENPQAVSFNASFSGAPQVTLVQSASQDGGQGNYGATDSSSPATTNSHTVFIDEDGGGADRSHTNEYTTHAAFEGASGYILSDETAGTITSSAIDFADGGGPKFERALVSKTEPGTSSSTLQVEYQTATGSWALIPDGQIPGNSTGISSTSVDLTSVDVNTYDTVRLVATLSCSGGDCPTLNDWAVEWSEGVTMSGTLKEYDRTTNVGSGTVRVAVNGTLIGSTGSVSGGAWSVSNVTAFAGDTVTVFVDGAPDDTEAVGVFIYDGSGDMTGVELYEQHLSLSADETSTTTIAALARSDRGSIGTEDVFFDVDYSGNLKVCAVSGCDMANLYIGNGNTFVPATTSSYTIETHDVINNGTLHVNANTIYVSGSWENDGQFSADTSSVIFTGTGVGWYDEAWGHRIPITVSANAIDSTVTDFPVYIDLGDLPTDFFTDVKSDGSDIRVTQSDGITEVPLEVVSINTGGQSGELYFKAPRLSYSADTNFYIYYDNTSANSYAVSDTYGRNNVWSRYEAVLHLNSTTITDSTGNGFTGTNNGATASTYNERNVLAFDGSSSYINLGDVLDMGTDDFTVSVNAISNSHDATFVAKSFYSGQDNRYALIDTTLSSHTGVYSLFDAGSTNYNTPTNNTTMYADGQMHHFAARYDRDGNNSLFVDGISRAIKDISASDGYNMNESNYVLLGRYPNTGGQVPNGVLNLDGKMWNVRFAREAFSNEWLKAENINQATTSDFYTVGTSSVPTGPTSATNEHLSGTLNFNDLSFNDAAGGTVWETRNVVTIADDLVVERGTLNRSTSTITVAGDVTTQANGFWSGVATTTFNGSSPSMWTDQNSASQNIGYVVIDGSAKTVTTQSNVRAGSITIGADDTLDAGGANKIEVAGNVTNNNTFTPRTSSLSIIGSSTDATLSLGGASLYTLRASTTGGSVSFTDATLRVLNDFEIATGTVTMPTGTTTISGSFRNTGGTFAHNNALVVMNSSGAETIEQRGTPFLNAFYDLTFDGSGSFSYIDTSATTSNNYMIENGSVTLPSGQLTVGADFITRGSGNFAHNNGELVFLVVDLDSIRANGSPFNDTRFRASDSGVTTTWYDADWKHRAPIVINASQVAENVTDFPVHVDLSDFNDHLFDHINSDGGDIRITKADGTSEVPREVVSASTTAKTGEVYFRADSLSSSTDATFYLYYGNSGASDYAVSDTFGAENVWTNNFAAVYHLEEENAVDSTSNGNDGTNNGTTNAAGFLGSGRQMSGYITISDDSSLDIADTLTISSWSYATAGDGVIVNKGGTPETYSHGIQNQDVNFTRERADGTNEYLDGTSNVALNEWHYLVSIDDGTDMRVYVDSVQDPTTHSSIGWDAGTDGSSVFIGNAEPLSNYAAAGITSWSGVLDEIRISSIDRSAGWISTAYNNQATSSDFYQIGAATGPTRIFSDTNTTVLGDVVIESGTVVFPTGVLTIGGSLQNDYQFSHSNGTVEFDSATGSETIAAGSSTFATARFDSPGGDWSITEAATATDAIVLHDAAQFKVNSGVTLESIGTFTNGIVGASTTWAGSTLRLSGGVDYAINSKDSVGDGYDTLTLVGDTDISMWNSSASTYDTRASSSIYSQDHSGTDGDLYIFGDYVRENGTEHWSYTTDFDGTMLGTSSARQVDVRVENAASVSASSSTLSIIGGPNASTSVDAQSGTFALKSKNATVTAEYVEMTGTDSGGFQLTGSSTVTRLDNVAFTIPPASSAITVDATTIDSNPAAQFFNTNFVSGGGNVNVTVSGTPNSYWWFREGAGDRYGEAFDNNDGNPGHVRWDDSSFTVDISGTVYADDGTTPLGGPTCDGVTQNVRVVVDGGAYASSTSCNGIDGSYAFTNVSYNGDPSVTVYLDTNGGERGAVVTRTPTADISDLNIYQDRVMTRHEDSAPMTIAKMTHYDASNDSDIPYSAATGSPNTLTVRPETELIIASSTTFSPNGNITLQSGGGGAVYDGSFHIDDNATFTASGTQSHSIGGSFFRDEGATFTSASSTVAFTSTTTGRTITATSTIGFYDIDFTGVGGGWNLNTDISVAGNIEVASGTLTGTGSITVPNGSFSGDGLVSLGGGTVTLARTNTLGGSQGWTFNDLTLGDGTVIGTTTPASNATTTVNGVLTIDTAHFLDAGASSWNLGGSGTVFVENGTFLEDTSTVRYSGGTGADILSTTYYNLDLNASAGTPTYTAVGLGSIVSGDLTVGGVAPTVADFDLNDSALSVVGDVHIRGNGTFVGSDSADLIVSGSWDNDGTYTASGGTVEFDSSDAYSIAAGSGSFGSVSVTGVGLGTITEHATSTGAWALASSSDFTVASGTRLAVGGAFINGAGGGSTTWTGSTLHLFGVGNFEINASTTNDQYYVLSAASGTHVRTWNSDAASYLTAPNGSVYSMDHAGVDGDLSIYGNYDQDTLTDHWSYGTDFDGTDLSGGSERRVDVYLESAATARWSGGGLSAIGTTSASTTVQNQGSGTYGITFSGGTTQWDRVVVRDIDSDGVTFSGTPTVSDFSHTDLRVEINSGSAVTVGGMVIDANPAKNFDRNRFTAAGGVTGVVNVTATGTSVSSWRFTNHAGALSGEANDSDPGGDPGYIVWDDSASLITVSGNVYSDEGSTVSGVCDGTTNNITLVVAGLTTASTTCDGGTGAYTFTNVNFSANDTLTLYIDGESAQAANVSIDPISNISDMDLYENRVIVRHEDTNAITIDDMRVWDSSDDGDIPFTAQNGSPDTLTLPSDTKLIVWGNKEFAPGGNVTLAGVGGGAAYDGTLELFANARFSAANGENHSIGGSFLAGAGASFTAAESNVTFTTTGATRTIDTNDDVFYDVAFTGSGSWTVANTNFDTNDLTISNGSLTLPAGTTTVSGSLSTTGSGSFDANGGTLVFDSSDGGETVTANGSDFAEIRFAGGGSWSMNDTSATATGAFMISSGNVNLPSGTLTVGGEFKNTDSFSHNNGELRLTNSAATGLHLSGSDLNGLTFAGSGPYTMEDENAAVLGDLTVANGSVTFATGTLSIGGSLDATGGGFEHASGTILFNSSDTGETVDPGSSPFYNVNFSAPGGGWIVQSDATTTGNFSLTNASNFTLASGSTLTVSGIFTNTVGGSATTWSGTTLKIDSGSDYTINTKTSGNEHYETLVIGAGTDLRTWSTVATTTTLASSSSLYSQDHANADGELTIYGDYHRSVGSDYWSYATDFDGTDLSGGSERLVTVQFADGATSTLDGGTLEVQGVLGATTTVESIGSGNYAFRVSSGVFDAQYYALRDMDARGLQLQGTSTILSLSHGDLELNVNGGSLITLDVDTLNANASLNTIGTRFAMVAPAVTGTNINLSATSSNAWTFSDSAGNLAGEAYDTDGLVSNDCGSIRWDDSSCQLVEQTHYRWRSDDGGIGVPASEWYDPDWDARKRVRVKNTDGTAYTDAVIKFTVPYDADMQSNFDDLRFTDSDGTTEVPYWIERVEASTEAIVWAEVPSLPTGDYATLFMYYDNATATTTSSSTQTFPLVDDFEDQDISEYSGDTGLFSVDSDFNYGGTYGLDNSGQESQRATDGIYRTDITASQGEIIRYLQYVDTAGGSSDEACTMFGVQSPGSSNQNYGVCLEQFGTDRLSLVRDVESTDTFGGVSVLATTTVNYTTGWYEVEIDWQSDDTIDVTLFDESGSVVATSTATDGTYTSGGIGFTYWGHNGGWDSYTSRPRMDSAPTVYFGAEQSDGGASWASDLDVAATGFEIGETARLRTAVENSGLDITGQRFALEFAPKAAAPTCASVSAANYSAVPTDASCGTSDICMATSTSVSDGANTTDLLFDTEGTFTAGRFVADPSNKTGSLDVAQNTYTEIEYAVTITAHAADESYCFRVTNDGTPLDAYTHLPELSLQFDPVISALSLNGGNDIALAAGTTTTVTATGTVTDLNGYSDLNIATSTIFRNGSTGVGEDCSENPNNCYRSVSPQCTFTGCVGNSCNLTCTADIQSFAEPTDIGSFAGDSWTAFVEIADTGGATTSASSPSVDLLTTRALTVENSIDYGTLSVNSDTGSYNATTSLQNIGNENIDVSIEGTDLSDGGTSVIPVSEQRFATSSFTYSSCVFCSTLSTSTSALEVDLTKPTSIAPPVIDEVYWGIKVPFGVAGTPHHGNNIFYAIGD